MPPEDRGAAPGDASTLASSRGLGDTLLGRGDGPEDWTSPAHIPLGYTRMRPAPGEDPDPRYIQSNLFTLAQIGGVYDLIALDVERRHASILEPWRLDSGAPHALDYIEYTHCRRQ